jgi:hypothetical protein
MMSDGCTDRKGGTLLNFLVHCPRGTMFIKSVDASTHVKGASLLCELMDGFIQEIGFHNVVHIITDNAANYVIQGIKKCSKIKVLKISQKQIHCIDLVLTIAMQLE